MERMKVLCMADVAACPRALDPVREIARVDVEPTDRARLLELIGQYDAYFATLEVRVDAEVLARAGRLKAIATPSTGTDHIDLVRARELGIEVISIHVHLDESTRGMIGRGEFAKTRDGVVIVNTSRGGIIDEAAFLEALQSGKVGAVGVDVIEGEWRSDLREHPLVRYAGTHENLVISPHIGGVTVESQEMAYNHTARKLAGFLAAAR